MKIPLEKPTQEPIPRPIKFAIGEGEERGYGKCLKCPGGGHLYVDRQFL